MKFKVEIRKLLDGRKADVNEIKCSGCGAQHIGKTGRTLYERTREHAWSDLESPLRNQNVNTFNIHLECLT